MKWFDMIDLLNLIFSISLTSNLSKILRLTVQNSESIEILHEHMSELFKVSGSLLKETSELLHLYQDLAHLIHG